MSEKTPNQNVNLREVTFALLDALDSRSKDIIARRFGLDGDKRETLESIGREYGITRERVRQIEAHTRKTLANLREQVAPVVTVLNTVFSAHGGVMAEPHIVEIMRSDETPVEEINPNFVRFYLHVLPDYTYVAHNSTFQPHWRHETSVHPHAERIVEVAEAILNENKQPIEQAQLLSEIKRQLPASDLPETFILAALIASKGVDRTAFGQWGVSSWPEVSPRGVGDKAYTILRRHGKPEHFRVITTLINQAQFDGKTANPQTVHNELIKDGRFVLVGRGLYGLKEWGFIPGTVGDVLESILQKAENPLTKEELINQVLKQRLVKKNTILLGLQNNKRFRKVAPNKYTLKTS